VQPVFVKPFIALTAAFKEHEKKEGLIRKTGKPENK